LEIEPYPDRWGLRLGDVVHGYRSCLDHAAWAMVKRGRTPNLTEHQESGVYFPISATRGKFNASLNGKRPKLPGVQRADIAIARRYQPYRYGKRNLALHSLWVLDELSRNDKHRSIQPILGTPDAAYYEVTNAADCIVRGIQPRALRKSLKVGSEVGRFYVKKTGPNPRLQVQGNVPVAPAINDRIHLDKWMELTMQVTFNILRLCAPPSANARAILDAAGVPMGPPPAT
jgi:hypothetical protein